MGKGGIHVSDDPLESIWELHDELARAAEPFEKAERNRTSVSAADPTGTVRAKLDAVGGVADIRVEMSWRQRLQPQELADVVVAALDAAALERVRAWGNDIAEPPAEVPTERHFLPSTSQSAAGRLQQILESSGDRVSQSALEELAATLREINGSVGAVTREVEASAVATFTGRSAIGHVTATVSGAGKVNELRYDDAWLERAHPANIGRESVEAIAAALRAAVGRDLRSIVENSAIGRFAALSRDPEALAARLGLGD